MIRFYYSESYPECKNLKEYLDAKNISYEIIDVDKSEDNAYELIRLTNQTSLPVIIIDNQLIAGFDREIIDKALENL